jgi:hypothetical protein
LFIVYAFGQGPIRQQLRELFTIIHPINETNFAEDLKRKYLWIESQLTRFGPAMDVSTIPEGSVDHTIRRITNVTGQKIAQTIAELEYEL